MAAWTPLLHMHECPVSRLFRTLRCRHTRLGAELVGVLEKSTGMREVRSRMSEGVSASVSTDPSQAGQRQPAGVIISNTIHHLSNDST